MGYLDSLPEGLQSVYGGTQQLYRKPQYTQIGQTRVTSPTRLPLGGSMYGGQALDLPTVGAGDPSPLAPTPEQGISVTGVQTGAEDYLRDTGDWERHVGSEGQETWLPRTAEEGQWYEDETGQVWFRERGEWQEQETEGVATADITSNLSWATKKISADLNWLNKYVDMNQTPFGTNHVVRGISNYLNGSATIEELKALALTDVPGKAEWDKIIPLLEVHEAKVIEIKKYADMLGIDVDVNRLRNDYQYGKDIEAQINTRVSEEGEFVNITNFEGLQQNLITGWQENITEFMDSFESGDITYDSDTGTFVDAEGNAQTGWVTDWMSEVVGKSYETGGISGELFTTDEDGNIVLAEELQTMSDWFENNTDAQQDYMEYNRQLAAHAIASGKSLNSGYYSEAAADAVSNYAAQQTDQIAKVMMEDIGSQFEYIANSIANMMKGIWEDNKRNAFLDQMETQRAALEQQYKQWTEQMAANVAETNAARQGEIITAIFTFIINVGLAFL